MSSLPSLPSLPSSECPFCFEDDIKDPIELTCGHMYCRECVVGWFTSQIDEKKIEIVCDTCRVAVEQWVLESILPPDVFEKYTRFSLDKVLESEFSIFHCPNKDCHNVFAVEEGVKHVKCPKCVKNYCMECMVGWHTGVTCAKYQEWASENKDSDALTLKFLRNGGGKQCPKCSVWIEKNSGCDYMMCRKCKYQFWWSTLESYEYNLNRSKWLPGQEAGESSKDRMLKDAYAWQAALASHRGPYTREELQPLTAWRLQDVCRKLGIGEGGNKDVLIARILA
jgi:hypothetical protein